MEEVDEDYLRTTRLVSRNHWSTILLFYCVVYADNSPKIFFSLSLSLFLPIVL